MRRYPWVFCCTASMAFATAVARADDNLPNEGASSAIPEPASVTESPAPPAFETAPAPRYEQPDQVLLPGNVTHGGFGAPALKFSTIRSEGAVFVGGQGGWILNHGLVIGGAGYGLATIHDAPAALSPATGRSTLQMGYGGPRLAYITNPHDVVHVTFAVLVGAGGYTVLTRNDAIDDSRTHDGHAFFVFEPEAEIEANLLRFLRVGFGVSYRYVGTHAVAGLESSDLSGPAAGLALRLGSF